MLQPTSTTLDLGEYLDASVLLAAQVPFKGLRFEGERVVFQFDDDHARATKTLSAHEDGNLTLPTKALTHAVEEIKTMMFSYRRTLKVEAPRASNGRFSR